jgi:hypothetical protein
MDLTLNQIANKKVILHLGNFRFRFSHHYRDIFLTIGTLRSNRAKGAKLRSRIDAIVATRARQSVEFPYSILPQRRQRVIEIFIAIFDKDISIRRYDDIMSL